MNNNRRKELRTLVNELEGVKDRLENIQSEEEDYHDNIPENMQDGDRARDSEEAIDKMIDAITCIEEAIEAIEEIV